MSHGGSARPRQAAVTQTQWLSQAPGWPYALKAHTLHPPHSPHLLVNCEGEGSGEGQSRVFGKLRQVAEMAKKRDLLSRSPSAAPEPFSASASGLESMLGPSWNFILEVEREKDRVGP